jgi:hypothetical protein
MGSVDSGRHVGAKKPRVEEHLVSLKVSELQRKGALAEGVVGTLSWDEAGRPVAKIDFRTPATDFIFTYEGANAKSVEERVPLVRVPAGFGGTRHYFRCPGPSCGRQVLALYLVGGLFRCRRCHRLAYLCQLEDPYRRAGRRADKARARLGYPTWQPFKLAPLARPKGMWPRTFWDLQAMIEAADYAAHEAFVARLQSVNDRLDRQAERRRPRQRD